MNQNKPGISDLKNVQWTGLVILRILIGWHLLYEGLLKLTDPFWTSAPYLKQSTWIFSGIFKAIAASPGWLLFVDIINTWALLLVGFALIAGIFSKSASYTGMVLLLIYYLAHPPFGESTAAGLQENSLIVNLVLIEAAGLFVLSMFPTGKIIGLDRLIHLLRGK